MLEFKRERIAQRRKLLGFTQKDVAERLGISEAAYNRMENGSRKIAAERLPEIAEALLCKVKFFYA
jgi:transcriptional regulator with XRE-family HTH domain